MQRVQGYLGMLVLVLSAVSGAPAQNEGKAAAPSLSLAEVVERMVARNQERTQALQAYTSTRHYHLEYHGIAGDRQADLVVAVSYQFPDRKEFTIVSEEGSKLLRDRVLKRLVEAEKEAAEGENQKRTAIHPDNYEFRLVGHERTPQREFYVLEAEPKVPNPYLFRGRIWVDGKDFAVVRIEGEPAENPSWWTKRNWIQHSYKKIGEFWLPARNETTTELRILGRSLLVIEYRDYRIASLPRSEGGMTVESVSPSQGTERN